jgi:hypothetical protein
VLGNTFANTPTGIVSYAARRGAGNIVVVHAANLAGEVARDAVRGPPHGRARRSRLGALRVFADRRHQRRPAGRGRRAQQRRERVLLTSDSAGALPFFAQLLPENGLDLETVRVMGLTRWDTPPQTLEFAGLQGGWFTVPDQAALAAFEGRYAAAYGSAPHTLASLAMTACARSPRPSPPRAASAAPT